MAESAFSKKSAPYLSVQSNTGDVSAQSSIGDRPTISQRSAAPAHSKLRSEPSTSAGSTAILLGLNDIVLVDRVLFLSLVRLKCHNLWQIVLSLVNKRSGNLRPGERRGHRGRNFAGRRPDGGGEGEARVSWSTPHRPASPHHLSAKPESSLILI